AVADRPAFGQHVVNVASIGIDKDRAWRFLAVVWNDLTLIGGWNRRLPIGRVRQLLPVPRSEICVPLRRPRCLHASAEQQSRPSRYDYDDLHDTIPWCYALGRADRVTPLFRFVCARRPLLPSHLPAQSPGEWPPDYLSPQAGRRFKCSRTGSGHFGLGSPRNGYRADGFSHLPPLRSPHRSP